ncbi:MAG: domain S-box-containing protein [Alphaproteobacteria bacterium]|nr:domain S-box-containing protein [Alphaproteobacteria bacterium]
MHNRSPDDSFLLQLGDRLQLIGDPREAMRVAAEMLGRHLCVDRVGYSEIDATGEYIMINDGWQAAAMPDVSGRHRLEDLGPAMAASLRAGIMTRYEDALAEGIARGDPIEEVYTRHRVRAVINFPLIKDGTLAAILFVHQAGPRHWNDDEVALVGRVGDRLWAVIQRERAERQLRQSEERLKMANRLVGLEVYSWDPNTNKLEWTDGIRAMWGLPPGARVTDATFEAAIHDEDRPSVQAAIRGCIDPKGDGIYQIDYRVIGVTDGLERWVSTWGQTSFSQDKPVSFIGAIVEITGQKQVEAQLRASEGLFRAFAENSSNVMWIVDPGTGLVDYRSEAFEAMFGEPDLPASRSVEHWSSRTHPDDRAIGRTALARVAEGAVEEFEYRITRLSDGATRWLRDTAFPIRDEGGRVVRVGGITSDITRHDSHHIYLVAGERVGRPLGRMLAGKGFRTKSFPTVRALLDVASALSPGCILLDRRTIGDASLDTLRELRARSIRMPVLVLGTPTDNIETAVKAMKAGASDYLSTFDDEALLTAVGISLADIVKTEPSSSNRAAAARISRLSTRERDVLEGLLAGGTNKSIGQLLGISPRTVELHRAHIMERLDVTSLPELVQTAIEAGLRAARPAT